MKHILLALAVTVAGISALPALAQGAKVVFGGLRTDTSAPVEVTADQLTVDQNTGAAVFTGNVAVVQGEMRLQAAEVRVEYSEGGKNRIKQLLASGGVILVSGVDAAEAAGAVYTIASGEIVMSGSVLLTQGGNAISGDKLMIDLNTGYGTMIGRVKTVLQPGGN